MTRKKLTVVKEIRREAVAVKISLREKNQTLGRAYLYVIFDDRHAQPYGLFDVFVQPNQRGRGLGSRLVKAVIAEAKARRCYKLIGTSRYSRPKVHVWYKSLGFKDYGKEFRMDLIKDSKIKTSD